MATVNVGATDTAVHVPMPVLVADHTTDHDPTSSRRFHELDALRGLAALTVAFAHFEIYRHIDTATLPIPRKIIAGLTETLYAGPEAVMMFFVLSGFVLSLPYFRGKQQAYPIFLGRRIIRIYGPYLAALAVAVVTNFLLRDKVNAISHQVDLWREFPDTRSVLQHVFLIGFPDTNRYNPAFWSLIPEMRISLIFPMLIWAVKGRSFRIGVLLAVACSTLGIIIGEANWFGNETLGVYRSVHYVALFLIGILLAKHRHVVERVWRRTSTSAHITFALASLLFYFNDARLMTLVTKLMHEGNRPLPLGMVADWMAALGSAGIIVTSLNSRFVSRVLNSSAPRFLGRISFSLYLIHFPVAGILFTVCYGRVSTWIQFFMYLALILVLSWLFCIFVEEPCIHLGRSLGKLRRVPRGQDARA